MHHTAATNKNKINVAPGPERKLITATNINKTDVAQGPVIKLATCPPIRGNQIQNKVAPGPRSKFENWLSPVIQANWEARTVGWLVVERQLPSAYSSSTQHQQKPEFESQQDLVLNTVIVLNV